MGKRTFIIVLIILVIVAIFSIIAYLPAQFDATTSVRISDFPKVIDEWKGEDIPLDKRTYDLLETDNLIMRDYTNPQGDVVNLYIIYSQTNRKVSHPPEICLQGEGAVVVEKSVARISPALSAAKLILEKKDFQEAAFYWYKAGPAFTSEYLRQQVKASIDRMLGKQTSVALIRVIAQIKGQDRESAFTLLTSFSRKIEPLLHQYAP